MTLQAVKPLLRIFDEALAKAFYVDWLGFTIDWEHRFGPDFPLYMQVARDGVVLHLTGHYGDCSAGAKIFIEVDDVDGLHAELATRFNPHMRPQVETADWNARILNVTDPFGNRICFNQSLPE